MSKPIPRIILDDITIDTLDELRAFYSTELIAYLHNGQLAKWLRAKHLYNEADAIERIDLDGTDLTLFLAMIHALYPELYENNDWVTMFTASEYRCGLLPSGLDEDAIFVQCKKYGEASYHFDSVLGSYINYENFEDTEFDDGTPFPKRKYFSQVASDKQMLHAVIDWAADGVTFAGASEWHYIMQFDADFTRIIGGSVTFMSPNGKVLSISKYPIDECVLNYTRYNK